jgi:hypothetical protein
MNMKKSEVNLAEEILKQNQKTHNQHQEINRDSFN